MGINDNKNSMVEVLHAAKTNGIIVLLDKGELKIRVKKKAEVNAKILEYLKENKPLIVEFLKSQAQAGLKHPGIAEIERSTPIKDNRYPMSFEQESLWFEDKFEETSVNSHIPAVFEVRGTVDGEILLKSFKQVIKRHKTLRTVFKEEDGQGFQSFLDWNDFEITTGTISPDHKEKEIYDTITKPFDLALDFKIRVKLLQVTAKESLLIVILHHISADGWSMPILVKELSSIYNAILVDTEIELPKMGIQYTDYCIWQKQYLDGKVLEERLAFWEEHLKGYEILKLPSNPRSIAGSGNQGAVHEFTIDTDLQGKWFDLCRKSATTPFMFLLGVYTLLLQRYSGQNDIVVGIPIANREKMEVSGLIGFFANILALRLSCDPNMSFSTFLAMIKRIFLSCQDYQDVPFSKVFDRVAKNRDLDGNPLVKAAFSMTQELNMDSLSFGRSNIILQDVRQDSVKFDISMEFKEREEGIRGRMLYRSDIFSKALVEQMANHYLLLLTSVLDDPEIPLGKVLMLCDSERSLLLGYSRGDLVGSPLGPGGSVLDLLGSSVRLHGEGVAVESGGSVLSYRELWSLSDSLALHLRGLGLEVGARAVVYLDRGLELVVAMLGIWKAGLVYVPVDVSHPVGRLGHILSDSGAGALVCASCPDGLSLEGLAVVLAGDRYPVGAPSGGRPSPVGGDLAYILYTSGTTGFPKGVMVSHGNLYWYLRGISGRFMEGGTQAVLSSNGFDIFHFELFRPLLSGGRALLLPEGSLGDMGFLLDVLGRCDSFHAVPALMSAIAEAVAELGPAAPQRGVTELYTGGDRVPVRLLSRLREVFPESVLHEFYGPTEGTVFVTVCTHASGDALGGVPSLGRPMGHNRVLVLDGGLRPCPVGVPGELYIGGPQVTLGYLGDAPATGSHYVPDPFGGGGLLYRTGDLGRWLPDGTLSFLGRSDRQVKVRGHRIEPGEVEQVLESLPGVVRAVVSAMELGGSLQLVAHVVAAPGAPAGPGWPSRSLRGRLPDYMVPGHYVLLDELPLTPNGKVDHGSLPKPDLGSGPVHVAPTTEVEAAMVGIWESILGVSPIGTGDNFFELGGDSIKAIQLMARSRAQGIHFKVKDLFRHQSIGELSGHLGTAVEIVREEGLLEGPVGLLPIQREFFEMGHPEPWHYNQSVLLSLPGDLPGPLLSGAVQALCSHHDALRLGYVTSGTEVLQSYGTELPRLVEERATADRGIDAICGEYQLSLGPSGGESVRFVRIVTGDTTDRLFIVAHHLCMDGVSWRILLEDLGALLGGTRSLPAKGTSYRQWQERLADRASSPSLVGEVGYWEGVLGDYSALPTDLPSTAPGTIGGMARHLDVLDRSATGELLGGVHRAYGTETNDVLLAALGRTLAQWSGRDHVVVGLEGHGREELFAEVDLSRTVGWFTSSYPVRLVLQQGIGEQLKETKDMLRDLPEHGLGYGLLRYLSGDASVRSRLSVDYGCVVFNHLGSFDNSLSEGGALSPAGESRGNDISSSNRAMARISVTSMVVGGELHTEWSYDRSLYRAGTIEELSRGYREALLDIMAHCRGLGRSMTRSDHGLPPSITNVELDALLSDFSCEGLPVTGVYGLSPLQEGMLFHSLYGEGSLSYVSRFACDFPQGLDVGMFRASWAHLMERHGILRTSIHSDRFEIPVQCVHGNVPVPLEEIDCRHLSGAGLDRALAGHMEMESRRGFDLGLPPLFGFTLVHLPGGRTRLLMRNHHILWDGWSLSILMGQFIRCYGALSDGSPLPELGQSDYGRFIRHVRSLGKSGAEAHWKSYLEGLEGPTYLPFVEVSGRRNKVFGNTQDWLVLEGSLVSGLESYAREHRLTINTLVQGAWGYLLSCYTGSGTVVFGATVSGRDGGVGRVEEEVGLYINTIPVCTGVSPGAGLAPWLVSLQQCHARGREEHAHVSLGDIQRWTGAQGPLFDSLLVFDNYPLDEAVSKTSKPMAIENIATELYSNYVLTLGVQHSTGRLSIKFDYNDGLLADATVAMVQGHMTEVLRSIASGAKTLADLDYLTKDEERALLQAMRGNGTVPTKMANTTTVLGLFEQQVDKTPKTAAVLFENLEFSYDQLNMEANRLAHYLIKEYEIGEGDIAAVKLPRTKNALVAILAVLKTGAAYLPIDGNYPLERTNFMLRNSGAKILLTDSKDNLSCRHEFIVELKGLDLSKMKRSNPGVKIYPRTLAYVIYTSGSTGLPKGVMVEHGSLANYITWANGHYLDSKNEKFPLFSSLSFDLTLTSIFMPLTTGNSIMVYGEKDGLSIEHVVKDNLATIIKLTPSHLHIVNEYCRANNIKSNLRKFIVGGELLKTDLVNSLYETIGPELKIYNEYGPTEATVGCMCHEYLPIEDRSSANVPIGKAIKNTGIYVLDDNLRPVPVGVQGKLYISGFGLARGYLNNPKLTQERFIPAPWDGKELLYDTGDLAFKKMDGNYDFVGRKDDQVKIRGYRIELGEIASVLESNPTISQAVVVLRNFTESTGQLVAYYVAENKISRDGLREHLAASLPDYMIPRHLIQVPKIPLTINGKLDTNSLPEVKLGKGGQLATSSIEKRLVSIWSSLLNIKEGQLGVDSDFFDLGGHSLIAIALINKISKEFNVKVTLDEVFENPTILGLSNIICAIDAQLAKSHTSIPTIEDRESYPLSSGQKRLYFLYEFNKDSIAYNMPYMLKIKGQPDVQRIADVIDTLVQRHEILRTRFVMEEGIPVQKISPKTRFSIQLFDHVVDIDRFMEEFIRPFDLSKDPLLRVAMVSMDKSEHYFIWDLHHIVSDGVSQDILMREFIQLYNGKSLSLPKLRYRDYCVWQGSGNQRMASEIQKDFWLEQFKPFPDPLNLPYDYLRPAIKQDAGRSIDFELGRQDTELLRQMAEKENTTMFMLVLSLYTILLGKLSDSEDIVVGTPIVGREHADLESTVGMFANTLAIRSFPKRELAFGQYLKNVKKRSIACFEHQGYPYEELVEQLQLERNTRRNPLFDAHFTYQKDEGSTLVMDGLELVTMPRRSTVSKFDITLLAIEKPDVLKLRFEYATSLFKEESIQRFSGFFKHIIQTVTTNGKCKLGEINIMPTSELSMVLDDFNATEVDYSGSGMFPVLFECAAARSPVSVALVFEGQTMSYGELERRSGELAVHLVEGGLDRGGLVGICLGRSLEMVIGILGVLRAGGAYVPIDPEYPDDRIGYILGDIGPGPILTQARYQERLSGLVASRSSLLALDTWSPGSTGGSAVLPEAMADDLMYVIYTSGTTGRPKGVMNEHGGVLNRLLWMRDYLGIGPGDTILQKTTFCFDVSVWELLLPLVTGCRMVLASPEGHRDPLYLQGLIRSQGVTVLHFVPSMLQAFLSGTDGVDCASVAHVVCSGEELRPVALSGFGDIFGNADLHNLYGPTEAAIDVTAINLSRYTGDGIPIGRPVANTRMYIVGENLGPVPIGVPGELLIGGVQVARGYLNLPGLTGERFVASPFVEGDRLYRTGDRAKWLPDGNIVYLGRGDGQVKIRGQRIELGEVESILNGHGSITASAVLVRDINGDHHLVAYYLSPEEIEKDKLQAHLSQFLPGFMVPEYFKWMASMPLNHNGKLDRKKLPNMELGQDLDHIPPANAIESRLVDLWSEILGLEKNQIGVTNNFFALGGQSLKAMVFITKLHKIFDIKVTLQEFFAKPSIRLIASHIANNPLASTKEDLDESKKNIIKI